MDDEISSETDQYGNEHSLQSVLSYIVECSIHCSIIVPNSETIISLKRKRGKVSNTEQPKAAKQTRANSSQAKSDPPYRKENLVSCVPGIAQSNQKMKRPQRAIVPAMSIHSKSSSPPITLALRPLLCGRRSIDALVHVTCSARHSTVGRACGTRGRIVHAAQFQPHQRVFVHV